MCDPPLATTWYVPRGMFHAVETSEHFACERKMFDYIKTRILQVDEETLNDEDYVIDHEGLILSAISSIKAF